MKELELNRDTVQFLIDAAHEFHGRDSVMFPDEPEMPNEDLARQMAADYGGNPYYTELKNAIEDLEPDQQVSLVALMWLGRADYTLDEWEEALQHAEDSWNDQTADYVIGTALMADYLAEGLEVFDTIEAGEAT